MIVVQSNVVYACVCVVRVSGCIRVYVWCVLVGVYACVCVARVSGCIACVCVCMCGAC